QRLRWQLLRNSARIILQGSQLRLITIIVISALIWIAVYAAGSAGFHVMQRQKIPFGGDIVAFLFDLLFMALAVFLIFSGGIILSSSLFTSPEAGFLLTTPVPADQVFAYRFQGSIAFSSWAFVLLGSPIIIAYGIAFEAHWTFYLLLPFFFLGFV